ncbi:3-dehydroquinate synthase [Alkalibacterium sp. AK22]|uniref:3-dehydroquinate synthase n=1 Tax=Alkalibacterium sp. AK22 TaxID=1229520 RepID=UPI000451B317|nr:3-dehydroquinate synthase [Alkalibacterium sp. AK22]EXJ22703.1 3-dehydroquinate synthase [Alkalibacterium sp. AK22]
MNEINVELPGESLSYPIQIEKGLLNRVGQELSALTASRRAAIITDQNVYRHYGDKVKSQLAAEGFAVTLIVLEPGEQTKTFDRMPGIFSDLIEAGLTRSDVIMALGGGVVGDIAGFAAASYLRGVDFVQIPTSLLAQVDSSVGGKVGVDLPEGKNLVGAFYHPKKVLIDPLVLETLTDHYFADGMAEVIKYGCIRDADFFKQLASLHSRAAVMEEIEDIIARCCEIKREVVELDEKDKGLRMLLNFGHTLGHAIEAYYQYESITHGHAVAIGMATLTRIAEKEKLSDAGTADRIASVLEQHQLPSALEEGEVYNHVLTYVKKDKKQLDNKLHAVILEKIGKATIHQTDVSFFESLKTGGKPL